MSVREGNFILLSVNSPSGGTGRQLEVVKEGFIEWSVTWGSTGIVT